MIEFRSKAVQNAMKQLQTYRDIMTRQEYSTIRGQIISGEIDAALKGIDTVARRKEAFEYAGAMTFK